MKNNIEYPPVQIPPPKKAVCALKTFFAHYMVLQVNGIA